MLVELFKPEESTRKDWDMGKKHELDRIAEESIAKHQKARSMLFLEAAIASLLVNYSIAEVATILRQHAGHLDEFS
jgi:hypothetical protein